MSTRSARARFALALAPLLALAACDQLGKVWGGRDAAGPAATAAREAIAGAVLPAAMMPEIIAPQPVAFVPGELIIGAKVEEQVAGAAAALGMMDEVAGQLRALAKGEEVVLDAKLEAAAAEAAVEEASRDIKTVLKRLGVDAAIDANAGGVIKIDLLAEKAAPLKLQAAEPAPAAGGPPTSPPTDQPTPPPGAETPPAEPAVLVETGAKCPRGVTTAQLQADPALLTQCTLERLRASRQFDYVEKNYIVETGFDILLRRPAEPKTPAPAGAPGTTPAPGGGAAPVTPTALPNDTLLGLQWHYKGKGVGAGLSPGGAGFEPFWLGLRQGGSRNVRVAVIDTGILQDHPDIKGSPNLLPGIDLVSNWDRAADGDGVDANPEDPGDRCGAQTESSFHGTHVAGTVGAVSTNDGKGVAGGAWNVGVVNVRAIGRCGGELEDIINAIRWSAGLAPAETEGGAPLVNANPADIINMSLSVAIPCPASMQAAIDAATARGAVIVVAAGNKSNPTRNFAPANCNNVVVVGAADARGALTFYSNFGPEVDILAPGGDLFNDTDNDGRPDGVLSTRITSKDCYDPETKAAAETCYYGYLQGTSMAAPHVSAALALLKSQFNVSGRQLEDMLLTRGVAPLEPGRCEIECARNPNATPIPGKPGVCARACGRGELDLGRFVTAGVTPASATLAAPR
jgi:serine protease